MQIEEIIKETLNNNDICKGDTILIHSSYKSFGKLIVDPNTIIKSLLWAIGDTGNLLFPTLSYSYVTENNPNFDVNLTKSCVGYLPEFFRQNYSEMRSIHPTHSVAGVGKDIKSILCDHEKDCTPCGEYSPFNKLHNLNGKIIMFGCGLLPNTTIHAIEEQIKPEYLFKDAIRYKIIDYKRVYLKTYKTHNFSGFEQRYDRIESVTGNNGIKRIKVLDSETYIIDSKKFWVSVKNKMKSDPLFFVDRIEDAN